MKTATSLLQLDTDEEGSDGSDFAENDQSVKSDDLDLDMSDYGSDVLEVSSGEFDALHTKKYATPMTFLHTLWNVAGPSAGAMRICLEIIINELSGQVAGVPADFKELPEELIQYMYKEAGEDPAEVSSSSFPKFTRKSAILRRRRTRSQIAASRLVRTANKIEM